MTVSAKASAEQAWETYQKIEALVDKKYQLSAPGSLLYHSKVAQSLQALGVAVLLRHNLTERNLISNKWATSIDQTKVKKLSLSTTEEMMEATIPVWEEGKYCPQMSLREALNLPRVASFFGFQSPLWGKTEALINVENELTS